MRELQHNEEFSNSSETRSLTLLTNGATVDLQLKCGGTFETMEMYTSNEVVDIDFKSGMVWRVVMSDSGASAKAYLSDPR